MSETRVELDRRYLHYQRSFNNANKRMGELRRELVATEQRKLEFAILLSKIACEIDAMEAKYGDAEVTQ